MQNKLTKNMGWTFIKCMYVCAFLSNRSIATTELTLNEYEVHRSYSVSAKLVILQIFEFCSCFHSASIEFIVFYAYLAMNFGFVAHLLTFGASFTWITSSNKIFFTSIPILASFEFRMGAALRKAKVNRTCNTLNQIQNG